MQGLFDWTIAKAWLSLITERVFEVVPPGEEISIKEGFKNVRYNRGQPMGMYSSWGLLALTHHMMVQFCANRVLKANTGVRPSTWSDGPLPFNDYLVLGDDIVIACKLVADEYVKFCERSYVILNMSKSLISDDSFMNFASQSVRGGVNYSPASLKDHFQVTSLTQRVALLSNLAKRQFFGEKLSLGILIRGLFTPQVWKTRIRASYRSGELTYPLRIGIAALANQKMFPSLVVTSPFLVPWLPSITGIERHFKDMLYNLNRGTESSYSLISFWAECIAMTFSSELAPMSCLEGIVSQQETANMRLRVYPSLKPWQEELDDNAKFLALLEKGGYNKVEKARRSFLLYRLDRQGGRTVPVFNRGFQSLDGLLAAIAHDIQVYLDICQQPGYLFRVPKEGKTVSNTAPHFWRDILLSGDARASPDPLALSQLLSRISRKVKPLITECEQTGRSINWIAS
jgi:hypothetical protein